MSNIIEVSNFTKKYGSFTAVDSISFDVQAGTIFSFLGPNGAGKSTTIKALCTVLDSTSGSLQICGYDVSKDKDKVRRQIGLVFQESTLDNKLTVEENIKFHCDFYGVPRGEVEDRVTFALDLVDLKPWRKAPVGSLSGGMKRRAEIARGLVHYPKVLFLDEPTTGLDPQTRAHVWDYIQKLQKEKSITIFLTTHYMDEAEISDKVAVMDHGKIAAIGTPADLKAKYATSVSKIRVRDGSKLETTLTSTPMEYEMCDVGTGEVVYTLRPKAVAHLVDVLSSVRDSLLSIEVTNGTLNDVFLAVTGREIRE